MSGAYARGIVVFSVVCAVVGVVLAAVGIVVFIGHWVGF